MRNVIGFLSGVVLVLLLATSMEASAQTCPEAFDAAAYFETNGAEWGQYFGAGFTFAALGHVLVFPARQLLKFIVDALR